MYSKDNLPSDDEILEMSRADNQIELKGGEWCAARVILLGSDLVLKSGYVTPEEAYNQHYAYCNLDPEIVRVPKVYRFFQDGGTGYLLMEYIDKFEDVPSPNADAVAGEILHIQGLTSKTVGPINGGPCHGLFDDLPKELEFADKQDLERFLNWHLVGTDRWQFRFGRRPQRPFVEKFDLSAQELVMCHMDIASRNYSVLPDGAVCVIDWARAGYYPRYFETARLETHRPANPSAMQFQLDVAAALQRLSPLSVNEQEYLESWKRVYCNTVTVAFEDWIPAKKKRPFNKLAETEDSENTVSSTRTLRTIFRPLNRETLSSSDGTAARAAGESHDDESDDDGNTEAVDWETAWPSKAQMLRICSDPNRRIVSRREDGSTEVIRLGSKLAIKHGLVPVEEARNQSFAHARLDCNIIRVPRPHRFFEDNGYGYLLMEYIDGFCRDSIASADKLAAALEHLHSIESEIMGPCGGRFCRGVLDDDDRTCPSNQDDFERTMDCRFNGRDFKSDASAEESNQELSSVNKADFKGLELVFCHMNLTPRNMCMMSDGSICLLDWNCSGFYPRCFEYAILEPRHDLDSGSRNLQQTLLTSFRQFKPLSANKVYLKDMLMRVSGKVAFQGCE